MFDSILVPLDGSRFAEAALPLATGLARSAHGKIRLALVHQPEMVAAGEGEESLGFGMVPIAESASERGYLAEIAASLGTNGDPRLTEILGGAPGPSLSEGISARHPDLVVLATHGWGPLARLWEEGVSSHLIRELSIPLLLVPPAGRSAMGDNWTCRRILVPLDLSGSSREILGPAQTLARLTQSHLTLVHVVEPMPGHGDPDLSASPGERSTVEAAERARVQKRLDREADRLREAGFSVATRVESGGGVAATLCDLLEKGCYDLIALTTHGRGGVREERLGSVADRVIRSASKPVLVVRPGARGDAH